MTTHKNIASLEYINNTSLVFEILVNYLQSINKHVQPSRYNNN